MIEATDVIVAVLPFVLGMGSSLLTPKYKPCPNTVKPSIQPPPYVFVAAWTLIYVLFGASCVIAFLAYGRKWGPGLVSAFVLLFFLVLWGPIFFNVCLSELAFVSIVGLIGLTFGAILVYARESMIASALLLVPLNVWLVFAGYISFLSF